MQIFSTLFRYRDQKSPDKLGLYPEKYHIKAMPERRYLWTSRVLAIWAAINICITVMLSMTIYLMLPTQTAKPLLFEEKYDKLEATLPQMQSFPAMELVTEYHINEYINIRHSFPKNLADLHWRWNETSLFHSYSSSEVYKDFQDQFQFDEVKRYVRKGYKRTIEIDEIKNLSSNLYAVRFRTLTTSKKRTEPKISFWRAYMRVGYVAFDPQNPPKDYLINPFGFTVFTYEFSYLGSPDTKGKGYMEDS